MLIFNNSNEIMVNMYNYIDYIDLLNRNIISENGRLKYNITQNVNQHTGIIYMTNGTLNLRISPLFIIDRSGFLYFNIDLRNGF